MDQAMLGTSPNMTRTEGCPQATYSLAIHRPARYDRAYLVIAQMMYVYIHIVTSAGSADLRGVDSRS